jgi:hypothetical protein
MQKNGMPMLCGGRGMRSCVATLLACVLVVASCRSENAPAPASSSETAAGPPTPAPAVTQASWASDALEELLAPIALYPDQLLGQILAASVNSQEVLDGGNWLLQNQNLQGNELDAAAQKVGFGPAMLALLQYPTVVDMMCQEIDWTRQVGSAFNSDQKSVLDAVQRLRMQAADVGNLKSTPQQTVVSKNEGGNVIVEVKPADPQIVYVPQYDPQVVYTTPPPAAPAQPAAPAATAATNSSNTATTTTTTEKEKDGVSTGTAVAAALIAFGVGVAVGNATNDDYYYPAWGYGSVYYGPRPFYPPAYAYRPVYGPAFRPAYGYAAPPGYRNNYNNVRGNNNVVINNKNYYNRFNNNQNLRTGGTRSPIASQPKVGQPRAGQTARPATASNWKGQSSYAGARNTDAGTSSRQTPREGQTSRESARQTPRETPRQTSREAPRESRPGSGAATQSPRVTPQPTQGLNSTPRQTQPSRESPVRTADAGSRVDRGYGDATPQPSREVNTSPQSRPSAPQADRSEPRRDSAFSGAQTQNTGGFQRSASARGEASVGTRQPSGARKR